MDEAAQSFERGAIKGTFMLDESYVFFIGRGFLGAQPLEIIKMATIKNKELNLLVFKILICNRFCKIKDFC